ncbi:MAG: MFS transporter [Planctomycetota bacterium]|jgi:DHA1 family quinolone resistance protein-like MFS transporter
MTRFLIYLFPAIADLIVAATMFVCSIRLADAGRSRTEVAMVFATWAAVYIASNLILSRFVTSRNAAAMLIVANLLFTATAGTFVLIEGIWAIYAIMAVLAVATALFFLPFQVFMKAVEPDQHRGVLRSAAIYTFSWSLGFASGPFIAGFIYQGLGWQWCFAFTGFQSSCKVEKVNYHAMPDLAWLGWGVAGVGCLGLFSFLALLPSVGVDFAIPKSQIGSIIASLYVVQALVGLSFLHSRTWMFRPRPVMGFAAFGVIGLTGFGVSLLPVIDGIEVLNVSLQTLGLYASVVCYGVFSGSFFFGLVFYSLVHPHRSAIYVAVNETVVGICGVVGPVMAGVLADRFGFAAFPVILIGMIVGVAMLQFIVLKRLAGKLAEQQPEIVRW